MTTLPIKAYTLELPSLSDGINYLFIHFIAINEYFQEEVSPSIGILGVSTNTTTTPYPTFASIDDAISYFGITQGPALLSFVNTDAGFTAFSTYDIEQVDPATTEAIDQAITTAVAALTSVYVPQTRTINGHALSGNVTIIYSDISGAPTVPTATSQLTNDSSFITTSSLSSYLTSSIATSTYVPLTRTVNGKALSTNITLAASDLSLATVASSGAYTDLTGKPSIPAAQIQSDYIQTSSGSLDFIKNKPKVYNYNSGTSPTLRSIPVELTGSATVSSGTIVFQLTDNGLSTGNALFPNAIDYVKAEVSNSTASFNYAYALTNSNKTLTITVNQVTVALGLLTFNAAANGVNVSIFVKGN